MYQIIGRKGHYLDPTVAETYAKECARFCREDDEQGGSGDHESIITDYAVAIGVNAEDFQELVTKFI